MWFRLFSFWHNDCFIFYIDECTGHWECELDHADYLIWPIVGEKK